MCFLPILWKFCWHLKLKDRCGSCSQQTAEVGGQDDLPATPHHGGVCIISIRFCERCVSMLWCYLSFFSKLIAVPSIHKFEAMKGLVQPAESVLLMPSQVRSGRLRCHLQSQQRIVQILFRMIVNANIWIFRLVHCMKMLAEQIPSILSARLGRETPAWLSSDTTGSKWGCSRD